MRGGADGAPELRRPTSERWALPLLLLLLAAAALAVFATPAPDLAAARVFHDADGSRPWPGADAALWRAAYYGTPWLVAVTGLGAVGVLAAAAAGRVSAASRRQALYVLLCFLLGPGLLVNAVLKDHWGRPRPRDIVEFGGAREYARAWEKGTAGSGKSFPCGHASVGFAYSAFYFLWRRRRPRAAVAALSGSVLLGGWIGAARMAAGGHFLSDVVWAGVLVIAVNGALHRFVMRVPAREAAEGAAGAMAGAGLPVWRWAGLGLLAAVVVAGVLLAFPLHLRVERSIGAPPFPPSGGRVTLQLDGADVVLHPLEPAGPRLRIEGEAHGFGFPWTRVREEIDAREERLGAVRYALRHDGFAAEFSAALRVGVNPSGLAAVAVLDQRGTLRMDDPEGKLAGIPILRSGDPGN